MDNRMHTIKIFSPLAYTAGTSYAFLCFLMRATCPAHSLLQFPHLYVQIFSSTIGSDSKKGWVKN
jgi:hypothetical protein